MASRRDVVTFLTAPARSGKSFNEVRRLCDETLPLESGPVYTNLPLKSERIAQYCATRHGLDFEEVLERIHLIPRDIERQWKEAGQTVYDHGIAIGKQKPTGPWDYFADKPLSGATIIIDEIHNFCGSIGTPKAISNQWQKWLGELGHNQAVFRCLSQSPEKVHACIKQEAQASYTIRNTGLDRDPYFSIEIYDWLELWCGLTGADYRVFVFEQETKKVEGCAARGKRTMHLMGPPYFEFYDSFNAPIAHAQAADIKPFEHEFERHLRKGAFAGRLSLCWWFFKKYCYELISRGFIGCALIVLFWLMVTGIGPRLLTKTVLDITTGAARKAAAASETSGGERQTVQPKTEPKPTTHGADTKESAAKKAANMPPSAQAEAMGPPLPPELRGNKSTELVPALSAPEQERATKETSAPAELVMLTPESVMFRKGHCYSVGQTIESGPFKSRTITRINWQQRSITLDDSDIVTLGE